MTDDKITSIYANTIGNGKADRDTLDAMAVAGVITKRDGVDSVSYCERIGRIEYRHARYVSRIY